MYKTSKFGIETNYELITVIELHDLFLSESQEPQKQESQDNRLMLSRIKNFFNIHV
jgi:hypothetical protein